MVKNYNLTRDELQNSLEENLDLLQTDEQEEIFITDNKGENIEAVLISIDEFESLANSLIKLYKKEDEEGKVILKKLKSIEDKVDLMLDAK